MLQRKQRKNFVDLLKCSRAQFTNKALRFLLFANSSQRADLFYEVTHNGLLKQKFSNQLYGSDLTLLGNQAESNLNYSENEKSLYQIVELYTRGRYDQTIDLAKRYLKIKPFAFQVAVIFCKALLNNSEVFPDDLNISYIKNIYSIYKMDCGYREAIQLLLRELKQNHGSVLRIKIMRDNMNSINKSRINVDVDKILQQHQDQWQETYQKYLKLSRSSYKFIGIDLSEHEASIQFTKLAESLNIIYRMDKHS